jgi:hypothetical protein
MCSRRDRFTTRLAAPSEKTARFLLGQYIGVKTL